MDIIGMHTGPPLLVHDPSECAGQHCCVHNPSPHHMVDWRLNWRGDRGLMERLCPNHGVGHPDPDDLAHKRRSGDMRQGLGVHGCCGCCVKARQA